MDESFEIDCMLIALFSVCRGSIFQGYKTLNQKYAVNALKPVANCSQDAKRETTASSCLHHAECLFLIGYKIKTGKLNYALSCNFREQDLIGLVSSGTVQIPLTAAS